jgi:hypothetical protein
LAQTCACLGQYEDALYYYKIRSELVGFWEEKYHSFFRCGELAEMLGHPWHDCMAWYMKAVEFSERAEPLIKIAEYYIRTQHWALAYTFADLACRLSYPDHCILFIDKHAYDYKRWSLVGILGFHTKRFNEGKAACINAIKCGLNNSLDQDNLNRYIALEESNIETPHINKHMTKSQFFENNTTKILEENPNLSPKQLKQKLTIQWKMYRKNILKEE